MQFQQDWQKDEKITALLIFLPEDLRLAGRNSPKVIFYSSLTAALQCDNSVLVSCSLMAAVLGHWTTLCMHTRVYVFVKYFK